MAIVHAITFRWKPDVDSQRVAELTEALRRYAASAGGLSLFACGEDLRLVEGNADYGIVAVFDSEDAFISYRNAEVHKALVESYLLPLLESRSGAQFAYNLSSGGFDER